MGLTRDFQQGNFHMNRLKAAKQLVKLAKDLMAGSVKKKRVGDLEPGDEVVNVIGKVRTVKSLPRPCRAPGYVRVETTGEPINTHKDSVVEVRV